MACRAQEDDFPNWNYNRKYGGVEYFDNPKKLEKLANAGDAAAAFEIGEACLTRGFSKGKICPKHEKDLVAALFWLHKAVDLGYADGAGEGFVGLEYTGPGMPVNEAMFWLKRSVEHGSPSGMKQMAMFYQQHPELPGAAEESAALYRKAADKGDIHAMVSLGGAYLFGRGVPKDSSQADFWFGRAEQSLNGYHSDDIAFNEFLMGQEYLTAGYPDRALQYLLWAGRRPAYYNPGQDVLQSYGQQEALKLLVQIYHGGKGVPANEEYAQACLSALQSLVDQENAQKQASDEQQAANFERNRQQNNAMIMGGLSSLASAVGSLNQPSPIQQSANTQLANIAAKQAHVEQVQSAKLPTASTTPATRLPTATEPTTQATNRTPPPPNMTERNFVPAPVATAKAPAAPGTGCQRVDYTVRVESQWFTPHDPNREVVYWVTNDTIAPVTCTFAFHKNGDWAEYVSGTYLANATHVGGQGRGSWTMGADSSDVKFVCFQGQDPVDANGQLCNDHQHFTGMTSAGSDWTPAPPKAH